MERCAGGILLCAVLAAAQPASDGRQILDQVVAAYTAVPGFELEATVSRSAPPTRTTIAIAYSAPDRLMLEDKSTGLITSFHDHGVATFNGKSGGFVGAPEPPPGVDPRKMLAAEATRRSQALLRIGYSDYTAIRNGLDSARILRQENLTVAGEAIACTVVEAAYAHNQKRTFWVDAARGAVLREVDVEPGEGAAKGATVEHSIDVLRASWGEPPPSELFEIEKHIRLSGATPPRPASMRDAHCDIGTEEAHIAHLNGMVTLKFTVDLNGTPRDIQVIGPLGLGTDDVAAECIAQSLFRPAEREGKPIVGTAQLSMSVQPNSSSDWNLGRVQFHPPIGSTRPVFLHAKYPPGSGAIGRAVFHLSAVIDRDGIPRNVEMAGGDPKFEKKAVEIVSSYRFKPGESDGQTVDVPANFDLVIGHGINTDTMPHSGPTCNVATPETQMARLNGKISLSFTVDSQGQPGEIQVAQPLGLGTDERAVECVAHSVQNPNGRDGKPIVGETSAALYVRAEPSYSDWNLGRATFQLPDGATRPVFLKANYPTPVKHSNGAFRPAIFHLRLTIDKNGIPRNVQATGTDYPKLDKQAASIVSAWRFRPGQLNDQPIDVPANFDLAVNWVLRINP